MTRNLYLGADLIPLAVQPSREAFEQAAAERFQTVLANDFATRAKPLAAEIVRPGAVGPGGRYKSMIPSGPTS